VPLILKFVRFVGIAFVGIAFVGILQYQVAKKGMIIEDRQGIRPRTGRGRQKTLYALPKSGQSSVLLLRAPVRQGSCLEGPSLFIFSA
jgi:hypothetical protein